VRGRLNLNAGTEISIDVQGEAMAMKPLVRNRPDWRTMRGMFRGGADLLRDLTAGGCRSVFKNSSGSARMRSTSCWTRQRKQFTQFLNNR
jgi:hypothetical protein